MVRRFVLGEDEPDRGLLGAEGHVIAFLTPGVVDPRPGFKTNVRRASGGHLFIDPATKPTQCDS